MKKDDSVRLNLTAHQATLAFLLTKAFNTLFRPRMLVIEHSFGEGFFCHEAHWESVTRKEVGLLEERMKHWIKNDTPLVFTQRSKEKVLKDLYGINSKSKLELVSCWDSDPIPVITFGDHWDIRFETMINDKTVLVPFELTQYNNGFLIRFPTSESPDKVPPFQDRPRLFSVFEEHENWGSILGVSTVRELNDLIRNSGIREMMWVAEGLHEKKIGHIADTLVEEFPARRIITVAGPSSSGKTTFAKRLGIQLRVNGYQTRQISMDDYFLDRNRIPRDGEGNQDFESISALNIDLLCKRVESLLNGNKIPVRKFDFNQGIGKDTNDSLSLGEWDFIVLEGIHGLNPILAEGLGVERIHRIYISAITQLNIDANHRFSTSDNRLLRRLVRDHKFRGYTPEQTLERWPSVRLGEERNIFPHQETADSMFNSALIYELPVLASVARPLLTNIRNNSRIEQEARRLEILLSFFESVEEEKVPGTSILREFIGNSEFQY